MTLSIARRTWLAAIAVLLLTASGTAAQTPAEPGLLFHLSGDKGLVADYSAAGTPTPNYENDVKVVADGAKGPGLSCGHLQLLSYWAPGNIYAERGTVSFFWRSREPVGPTAFPIFRVGYGDHSSWDMVWLRIDYNGKQGFDAFVTDIGLARTRVSMTMPAFPKPDEWVHLALAWDETQGIRFYVNGVLAGRKDGVAVFDAALDQFGPHSRIISPYQVQSAYNFVRGGDIDELRIYDRMLGDGNVAALAKHQPAGALPVLVRGLETPAARNQWALRYGWNRVGDVPPALTGPVTSVRKVEIHDAYDIKRWWWKGTDGIRETTWPGVYNWSRLPGRNDYFQLPDWDCYSTSGTSVTFNLPKEPWNHLEVSGAAFGTLALTGDRIAAPSSGKPIFDRPKGQDRTFHRLAAPVTGQNVVFTNVEQETPISEFAAYYVTDGKEPAGVTRLTYRLTATAQPAYPSLDEARRFIAGRYPAAAQATMVGLSSGALRLPAEPAAPGLPIVHVLIPSGFRDVVDYGLPRHNPMAASWRHNGGGLDGIAIDLPALKVKPTHGELVALNLVVKDPLWPMRAMLDFSFSVKPNEAHTLWLDLRDRILPDDQGLYLTIASAAPEFGPSMLEGAEVRLVFKPRKDAIAEHVADRFTQVRDNLAQLLEERPSNRRLNVYRRFENDLSDLLRVDPDHVLGRQYHWEYNRDGVRPPFSVILPPAGVPVWAQRQVEQVAQAANLVNWYIDHRQIENGEFGGGLSDDGDFTNWWPGSALMGATPEKIKASLMRHLDAFYAQGLFTNGLSTIQADELHSYEEGIQVLGQAMLLDHGGPKTIERAMETAAALERLTGVNKAGHRHIRSSYYSGSVIAEDGVWGWSKPSSYLVLHPAIALVEFNGAPRVRKLLLELADGLLAHRKDDGKGGASMPGAIHFASDAEAAGGPMAGGSERTWPLLWAAYRWTGDPKYIQPIKDAGPRGLNAIASNALDLMGVRAEWGPQITAAADEPGYGNHAMRHFAWQVSGDTERLESLYYDQIGESKLREFINTEGSVWIDRVTLPDGEIQRARLGGVASTRNSIYPGHVVSWAFAAPATAESVAVLVPQSTREKVRILAYNLATAPVKATMTAWDITPGTWTVTQGLGGDDHAAPATQVTSRTLPLGRSEDVEFTLAPRALTVIELTLGKKGVPYWDRPDLGISADAVTVTGNTVKVTVHSVGAKATPGAKVVLRDKAGKTLASANVPGLAAPLDLKPKSATVSLTVPTGSDLAGGSVTVEAGKTLEITKKNNVVRF